MTKRNYRCFAVDYFSSMTSPQSAKLVAAIEKLL